MIPDHDFAYDTVSDVEVPIDEALLAAGVGEVTGGGIGSGWYRIEMEILRLEEALGVLRRLATSLDLPSSTLFRAIGDRGAEPLVTATGDVEPQESGG